MKIATLNLCLGLRNKKDEIKRIIEHNNIDILCLQETELPGDYPIDLLSFKGYNYESENNIVKARCGIYISNTLSYVRRADLESAGTHVEIIDVNDNERTRIINIYRSFNPQNNESQIDFFTRQLAIISNAINNSTIVMGDFNLNYAKKFDMNYSHKNYFTKLNESFDSKDLIQIVNFDTWSRQINGTHHSSILDHVYVKNPININNLSSLTPPFGDHLLISFNLKAKFKKENQSLKRNWKLYSKDLLITKLSNVNW